MELRVSDVHTVLDIEPKNSEIMVYNILQELPLQIPSEAELVNTSEKPVNESIIYQMVKRDKVLFHLYLLCIAFNNENLEKKFRIRGFLKRRRSRLFSPPLRPKPQPSHLTLELTL